jgi:hypothetical protein
MDLTIGDRVRVTRKTSMLKGQIGTVIDTPLTLGRNTYVGLVMDNDPNRENLAFTTDEIEKI